MIENSPVIPKESSSEDVPDFFGTPIDHQLRHVSARFLCRASSRTFSQALTGVKRVAPCKCPSILVSDDDPFQGFFYEILFQRTIKWPKAVTKRGTPQFEVFTSGEDLIKRFKQIKDCGCDQTALVISDYNMGVHKLNGVQTIKSLRSAGYKGAVVLRTSEERRCLEKKHLDLTEMLESKVIDNFVGKSDSKAIREVAQEIITNVKTCENKLRSLVL